MACVAVNSLVRMLELEFLQPQPRPIIVRQYELISANKEMIESLHEKLESLMDQIDERRMDGVEAIKHLERKLRDVAFRVEDEIEYLIVDLYAGEDNQKIKKPVLWFHSAFRKAKAHSLKLGHILQQAIDFIDHIKEDLVKLNNKYEQGRNTAIDVSPTSDKVLMMGSPSQLNASQPQDIMVGKENEFNAIMDMLIQHPSKQREVVSIEGMGGIGKTTLAKQVYEDPSIVSHFDKRAWVVASQNHSKKQMLVGLLSSMGGAVSGSDDDLAFRLYQSLKGPRYLVVIDDVWSGDAWDVVKDCFPDDKNGSRVLLTTRLVEVVKYAGSKNEFSHQMHFLDKTESWNLFCKKITPKGAEFEAIAKQIVEKCKGLPLAIVVVAGLFSKLKTLVEWKNIAKDLNSSPTDIEKACSQMLSFSYHHLPHNLKACFLYLGVFPEDEGINAPNLGRLWIAEGLVKTFENMGFEAVAEKHIQELCDRNLILVSKKSSCGRKIKVFRVHDMVHAFCVREAQNENLLYIVNKNSPKNPWKGFRWLSISMQSFRLDTYTTFTSKSCRSVLDFRNPSEQEKFSLDLQTFRLLRVLFNFTPKGFLSLSNSVGLVNLRYLFGLQLFSPGKTITLKPLSAWNLQTLNVRIDSSKLSYIWKGPHLRYLYCASDFGKRHPKLFHQNLQSISWLEASNCAMAFVRNAPFLKRVFISGLRNDNIDDCLENLAHLQQLERLKISADSEPDILPIENVVALKNLKKLTICVSSFQWKDINLLCMLTWLEVLKLETSYNFDSNQEWELTEVVRFSQLIFLKIAFSALKQWNANDGNFPKLEHLHLYACKKLKEIPSCFSDIPTLKSIELNWCLRSTVISAKQIQEEQLDYGNTDMVVIETNTRDR